MRHTAVGLVSAMSFLAFAPRLAAQARSEAPPIVIRGLAALQADGPEATYSLWSATWPTTVQAEKKQGMLEGMQQLAGAAGRIEGFEVVRVFEVAPSIRKVYALIRYTVTPAYVEVVAYKPRDEWQVVNFRFHTDPAQVWPATMVNP